MRKRKYLPVLFALLSLCGIASTVAVIVNEANNELKGKAEHAIYLKWGSTQPVDSFVNLKEEEAKITSFAVAQPNTTLISGYSKLTIDLKPAIGESLLGVRVELYDNDPTKEANLITTLNGSDTSSNHNEYIEFNETTIASKLETVFYLKMSYFAYATNPIPKGSLVLSLAYAESIE